MKKVLSVLLLSLILVVPAFSNIGAIYGDKLPLDNEKFQQKSNLFLENYDYSSIYRFEWQFEKTKEQVTEEVKDFCDYLGTLKKPSYDVMLFRLIAMRCLYNLDGISSDEVKTYADQLKKKYKKEYRTWWVYGNYLATTSLVAESYDEFRTAMDISKGYITRPFLNDYVYSCCISGHIKRGWLALNKLAEIDEIPVEEEYHYALYANHLIFPKVTDTYDKNETWKVDAHKDGTYSIFSTLAGVSVDVKGEWRLNLFGFENGQTALTVSPEQFTAKDDNKIGATVLMIASAKEDAPENLMNIFKRKYPKPMTSTTKEINGIEFEVFEGEDLNTYADIRGGQRGIYLLAKIPYDEKSGIGLESSTSFNFESSGEGKEQKYYAVAPVLDRVPETVTVLLMLDTCNAIYKDSSKWFWDFVRNCKFE